MGRRTRTALVALASSALLFSSIPALSATADAAEPVIIDVPGSSIHGVAIDGDVLYVEDRRWTPSILRRTLSFETATAGPSEDLGIGSGVVAGDGQSAWKSMSQLIRSRNEAGLSLILRTVGDYPVEQVTKGWVLGNRQVIDLYTGSFRWTSDYPAALLDGVLYRNGSSWRTAGPNVIARDLQTGKTALLPAPNACTTVEGVQAAGSWMTMDCEGQTWVVDRTGAVAPFTIDTADRIMKLGAGFIAVLEGSTLSWSPLEGGSLELRTLSTTASSMAVSRGTIPSVAWVDDARTAHAALLPVAESVLPAHPSGASAVPSAPTVSAMTTSDSITLSWPAPSEDEHVMGYIVTPPTGSSFTLPATARSYTFTGLDLGFPYSMSVVAENPVGASATRTLVAAPLHPDPIQVDVTSADYAESTGMATVTWDYAPHPDHQRATSFEVSIGEHSVTGLPADARTVTIAAPGARLGDDVLVRAVSSSGASTTKRALGTHADAIPPVATIDLAPVTLGKKLFVAVTATDNRAVASIDLRMRLSSGPSKALGGWTYPPAWQGMAPTATPNTGVKPGATYCLSTRARDANNVSEWSPQVCTAVAIDEGALKKSGKWQKYSSPSYFGGSTLRVRSSTAYLSTPVRSADLYVVATTCPTCGKVGVTYGSQGTWMVDLRSTTKKHRQVIKVQGPKTFTGTAKIVRWGSNPALVDGFAVLGR